MLALPGLTISVKISKPLWKANIRSMINVNCIDKMSRYNQDYPKPTLAELEEADKKSNSIQMYQFNVIYCSNPLQINVGFLVFETNNIGILL